MDVRDTTNVGEFLTRPGNPVGMSNPPIPEPHTRTRTVEAGTVVSEGAMPTSIDLQMLEDVQVPVRDGVILYGDVYLPASGAIDLPTILIFTPYGKRGGYWNEHFVATRFGVPAGDLSGLQPFEAVDPAYWCAHGYAVLIVDARGTAYSGGDMAFLGSTQGLDIYDTVEWAAQQQWCSGAVGMAGNSQLAMVQWAAAATKPPHLLAIAPWEGLNDPYRDITLRGGIPDTTFHERDINAFLYGLNEIEDISSNTAQHPLFDEYWNDKRARLDDVDVAAYVVASWTSPIHARGTLTAFRELRSDQKWLRIHNTQEWVDGASPDNVADLRRFFDHFLLGVDNGWEETPRVRLSILDPDGTDLTNITKTEWPPLDAKEVELFLDAGNASLGWSPSDEQSSISYGSTDLGAFTTFTLPVQKDLTILGPVNVRLWIETDSGADIDIFGAVYKTDASGRRLHHLTFPAPGFQAFIRSLEHDGKLPSTVSYTGPVGRLRASHRALDPVRSTPTEPFLTHAAEEPLSPGVVVEVQLGLWPTGMVIHAGENLVLELAGHPVGPLAPPFMGDSGLPGGILDLTTRNAGTHTIRTGGDYQSRIVFLAEPS